MATLVEVGVETTVTIRRTAAGDRAILTVTSYAADGTTIRQSGSLDVTDLLPAARLQALLDSAEQFAKNRWSITP